MENKKTAILVVGMLRRLCYGCVEMRSRIGDCGSAAKLLEEARNMA